MRAAMAAQELPGGTQESTAAKLRQCFGFCNAGLLRQSVPTQGLQGRRATLWPIRNLYQFRTAKPICGRKCQPSRQRIRQTSGRSWQAYEPPLLVLVVLHDLIGKAKRWPFVMRSWNITA